MAERLRARDAEALGAQLELDLTDILDHKELQAGVSAKRLQAQEAQLDALRAELARSSTQAAALAAESAQRLAKLKEAEATAADREGVRDALRKQDAAVARQAEELAATGAQCAKLAGELAAATQRGDDLLLASSGYTALRVAFDETWLVAVTRKRLAGEGPRLVPGASLAAIGGKLLLHHGGAEEKSSGAARAVGGAARELFPLQLDASQWLRPVGSRASELLRDHAAATSGRSKMLIFGGVRGVRLTNEVSVLHTDTMQWGAAAVRGSVLPAPRRCAAASCSRDKMFVFGGEGEGGQLLADLWELNLETTHWSQVSFQPGGGSGRSHNAPPSARRGASLCAGDDGRHLWLFGGCDGARCLGDLLCFDVEAGQWSQVSPAGDAAPEPREGHCASILSRFLLVAGGMQNAPNGALRLLGDLHVLDMTAPAWECLDEGAWAAAAKPCRGAGAWSAFSGARLLTLRPGRDDCLTELQTTTLLLPEELERLRAERRRGAAVVADLEILEQAGVASDALEVAWRPPTKNRERISGYKVMIATATGVVATVYEGALQRCRAAGLKPGAEYIFCVKATYDDGSAAWSAPRTFHTRT
ncbi:hypothetical protein WJX81_002378 [Elliptochloris bilobata]|uniref:Fibronectin type-III domain-containing protein n=1 Tax=Elliptochloris bilobata TaxID=381761 RepID=A0AAW1QVA2_9CHLO